MATACGWCGSDLTGADGATGLTACGRCGALTTDPPPTEAELDAAYEGWYRPAGGRFSGPGDAVLDRLRGRLARRIDRIAPAGPVLDIGSGAGALLDSLVSRGRAARGLERTAVDDPRVSAAAVSDLGERAWAAIVFWHSLEHMREAGAVLDAACERLAPKGVIIVAMPNPASLQARALGPRWLALDLPRHLVHVPAGTLRARLEHNGLEVERISYLRGGQVAFGWLHGLVGLLPGRPDLYAAIRRPAARQVSTGGGRRALTLAAGALLLPAALLLSALEALARRGGTVYVEARRV